MQLHLGNPMLQTPRVTSSNWHRVRLVLSVLRSTSKVAELQNAELPPRMPAAGAGTAVR